MLFAEMKWLKVHAPCMHDYHLSIVALHSGPHENGVIELSLEKPDNGTGIVIEFGCNLTMEQIKECWGASFPLMSKKLARIQDYTGAVPDDN